MAQSLPRATHRLDKLYKKDPGRCINYGKKLIRKNKHKKEACYFISISYHQLYDNDRKTTSLANTLRYLEQFYKLSDDQLPLVDQGSIDAIKKSLEDKAATETEKKRYRSALKYAKRYQRVFGEELERQSVIEAKLTKRQSKKTSEPANNEPLDLTTPSYRFNENQLIADASKLLGTRFRYGGESRSGFDCSGFNVYVFRQSGVVLPHKAQLQSQMGKYIARDDCRKGDLIFFGSRRGRSVKITHTGMVYSNEDGKLKIIHCPNSGVCIEGEGDTSWDMYWEKRLLFIKRLPNNPLLTNKTQ